MRFFINLFLSFVFLLITACGDDIIYDETSRPLTHKDIDWDMDGYSNAVEFVLCGGSISPPSRGDIHPGAEEICDNQDNDCDGQTDEGFFDFDGDGWKDCVDINDDNDNVLDEDDCDDNNPQRGDRLEICDLMDNDCDGQTDEGNVCSPEGDYDNDEINDTLDNCPHIYNPSQDASECLDSDYDGVPDQVDNCPHIYNPSQWDDAC